MVKWKFAEEIVEFLQIDKSADTAKIRDDLTGGNTLDCVMNDEIAVFYLRLHHDIYIVVIDNLKTMTQFKVNGVRLELCALIEPNAYAPRMDLPSV